MKFPPISPSKIPLYAKIAHSRSTLKIERIRRFDFFEESHFIFCGFEVFCGVIDSFEVDFEVLSVCCWSGDLLA